VDEAPHSGAQRRFGHMADAVDVDPPDGAVGITGNRDSSRQMKDEIGSSKGVYERRRVDYISSKPLHIEPVECCTGPHIDGPYGLPGGGQRSHNVGPQVPRRAGDDESQLSLPGHF
jgi:hypothetical protein